MDYVSKPITFIRKINGTITDLIVPEVFVKDLHFPTKEHLMLMLRVVGPDTNKVVEFFEDGEDEIFHIHTVTADDTKIQDDYILTDIYLDEGPRLSVDIDIEAPMVRVILDFLMKEQ